MKRLFGVLMAVGLLVASCLGWAQMPQQAMAANLQSLTVAPVLLEAGNINFSTEAGPIDLNNTNVRAFRNYPGMYPTLARMVLKYAPFEKVEDVFDMPGLSDRQKEILQSNLEKFVANPPNDAQVEGADRFNNGVYR